MRLILTAAAVLFVVWYSNGLTIPAGGRPPGWVWTAPRDVRARWRAWQARREARL